MADEKPESEEHDPGAGGPPPTGKRKLVLFGGGGVALVALAWIAATMALPVEPDRVSFQGPFVAPLTAEKIQVNLSDSKSFLVVDLNLLFEAVDRAYYERRSSDEIYVAELQDALVNIASSKTRDEMSDKVTKPIFLEEVRQAVEPLLFAVHIGETQRPYDRDEDSRIGPGLSAARGTHRPPFGESVLRVDGPGRKLAIDDGPQTSWLGGETDLELRADDGRTLYLDLSEAREDFVGEVPIGIKGRVRQVKWSEILIQ